jgi:DNA invertase Pin-like site-specific DNA recombinase
MDLEQVEAAASTGDPREGLRMVLALHRLADRLEDAHVARAREQGMSWADIAVELQVTRQTVHKKHSRPRGPRRWSNHADV